MHAVGRTILDCFCTRMHTPASRARNRGNNRRKMPRRWARRPFRFPARPAGTHTAARSPAYIYIHSYRGDPRPAERAPELTRARTVYRSCGRAECASERGRGRGVAEISRGQSSARRLAFCSVPTACHVFYMYMYVYVLTNEWMGRIGSTSWTH
ncbi:hypothetical protein DFH11DRAFT_935822 [Phellopilus nigrolimitatus]|nr:hypothetical protein DFH11DRAFT_935822 [Phellopilus nigrolimitatus]